MDRKTARRLARRRIRRDIPSIDVAPRIVLTRPLTKRVAELIGDTFPPDRILDAIERYQDGRLTLESLERTADESTEPS